mmetsp:Transcript_9264/g.27170  ORF Transcript_9264/g.27170 Transcript_9264/m.27170 type:complete len:386 (+) Transcript_9264:1931-3088(+)
MPQRDAAGLLRLPDDVEAVVGQHGALVAPGVRVERHRRRLAQRRAVHAQLRLRLRNAADHVRVAPRIHVLGPLIHAALVRLGLHAPAGLEVDGLAGVVHAHAQVRHRAALPQQLLRLPLLALHLLVRLVGLRRLDGSSRHGYHRREAQRSVDVPLQRHLLRGLLGADEILHHRGEVLLHGDAAHRWDRRAKRREVHVRGPSHHLRRAVLVHGATIDARDGLRRAEVVQLRGNLGELCAPPLFRLGQLVGLLLRQRRVHLLPQRLARRDDALEVRLARVEVVPIAPRVKAPETALDESAEVVVHRQRLLSPLHVLLPQRLAPTQHAPTNALDSFGRRLEPRVPYAHPPAPEEALELERGAVLHGAVRVRVLKQRVQLGEYRRPRLV